MLALGFRCFSQSRCRGIVRQSSSHHDCLEADTKIPMLRAFSFFPFISYGPPVCGTVQLPFKIV